MRAGALDRKMFHELTVGCEYEQLAITLQLAGNFVEGARGVGIGAGQGGSLIGNISKNNQTGFLVTCPSNVTDNTAINDVAGNLVLNGAGCNNTNIVAP